MPCVKIPGGIYCYSPFYKLRLEDGTRVFMEFHRYCGPTFFHDKQCVRLIENWWENQMICQALDWFIKRGHKG